MMNAMPDEMVRVVAQTLGISDLPAKEQQELIASFGEVAMKASTLAVLGKLTEDKRKEFVELAKAGDGAALKAFLDREVPGHEQIAKAAIDEEVKRFKAAQGSADAGSAA